MIRKTVYPEGHWGLQVDIPYSMGLACSVMFYLCGQDDIEGDGNVCHPGDLLRQADHSIRHIENIVSELGASMEDLVKLVVFYTPDKDLDEQSFTAKLASVINTSNRPVITLVPVPGMFYSGLKIEIDAYGMLPSATRNRRDINLAGTGATAEGFTDMVRAGEMIFASGVTATDDDGEVKDSNDIIA